MGGEFMKHILDYYEVKAVPQKEIDKTLQALPIIYKKPSLLTKIKLQVLITPKYYYLLLLILTIFTIHTLSGYVGGLDSLTNNIYYTILFYLIAVISLTIPEISRAHMYQMEEMERSCRYHYTYLLFQRIILFSLMIIITSLTISIWCAYAHSASILVLMSIVFTPVLIILQATLIVYKLMNIKDILSRIITFITVSIICMILIVPYIINNPFMMNLLLVFIFIITLHWCIRKLFKEAKNNETFSIESE